MDPTPQTRLGLGRTDIAWDNEQELGVQIEEPFSIIAIESIFDSTQAPTHLQCTCCCTQGVMVVARDGHQSWTCDSACVFPAYTSNPSPEIIAFWLLYAQFRPGLPTSVPTELL